MSPCVYWFRTALRLHDNPLLLQCAKAPSHLCIYILSKEEIESNCGSNRFSFLFECLEDLNKQLEAFGSRLIVLRGDPVAISGKILASGAKLFFEEQYEPENVARDQKVKALVPRSAKKVVTEHGHCLYDPTVDAINPVTVYSSFLKRNSSKTVRQCVDSPSAFGKFAQSLLDELSEFKGPDKDFSIPSLKDVGKEDDSRESKFVGGETAGLSRMHAYIKDEKKVAAFAKPDTAPNAFNPPSTTVLSPYLRFGCLSIRKFYHALVDIEMRHKGHTSPPTSLMGQILWRDFYYAIGYATPNFNTMKDNKICLQAEWKCAERGESSIHLEAWTHGQTGFPFIDAIMIQLRNEGWIHHLARHAVACFLTRGDLYISWERGLDVFEELLLDHDYYLNAGNWMCAFFHQYFRVYSPVAFGLKTDKKGKYIRNYIPALAKVPDAFIYAPWKMSLAQQRACGCILGKDYPKPIVDHDEAKKGCMEGMKLAYEVRREEKAKEPVVKKRKLV